MKPQAQQRSSAAETNGIRNRRTEIVVIGSDDAFLIELGPVLGERYRTRIVDTPEALGTGTDASRWLALLDASTVPDARAAVARMEEAYRHAPIIVVADKVSEWTNAIARGSVVAVIAREDLSSSKLTDALAAAEARLASRSAAATAASAGKPTVASPRGALPLLAVVGALALGGGIWLWHSHSSHTSSPTTVATSRASEVASPAVAKPQTVLELLSSARVAFRDQKTLLPRSDGEPRGDSALELYTAVLAQEPSNDEALDGVQRLLSVGKARIQSDLAAGKLDDAGRLIGFFKAAHVDAGALHELEANITAARPKWLATRASDSIGAGDLNGAEQLIAQAAASGADRSTISELRRALDAKKLEQQLGALSAQVKSAVEQGALLDPSDDNARTRLASMRTLSRSNPLTLAAIHDVQTALLARAGDATRRDEFENAQRYIGAAAEIASNTEVAEAKRALQSEMDVVAQRAAAAATAAAAAREASSKSAAQSVAAAPRPSASTPAVAPHFIAARPIKGLRVEYPSAAADAQLRGHVTVEFTLHPDGTASDASIVEAEPANVFDYAAKQAVLRGHYDTTQLVKGAVTRARIKISFKPG